MTSTSIAHFLTPPQYAKRRGIDPAKVLVWIKRGELRAVNIALNTSGRPRYQISLDAIFEFEERRTATAPAKPVRRKRKQADDFVEYF